MKRSEIESRLEKSMRILREHIAKAPYLSCFVCLLMGIIVGLNSKAAITVIGLLAGALAVITIMSEGLGEKFGEGTDPGCDRSKHFFSDKEAQSQETSH